MARHAIDISESDGVRYLHFGSECVQGAMRIARPWSLELEYTREMFFPLLFLEEQTWLRRCLIVGLGAASQLKFLLRHFPETQVTVLEINPTLLPLAQQFFRLPQCPPSVEFIFADAADWLRSSPEIGYDLILLDAFGPRGMPKQLDKEESYQALGKLLSPEGYLSCNFLSRNRGFKTALARLQQAFPNSLALPPCESGNAIALAHRGPSRALDLGALLENALQLKQRTSLDLRPSLHRLQQNAFGENGHLSL